MSAERNLKTALTFEPDNAVFRALLQELLGRPTGAAAR